LEVDKIKVDETDDIIDICQDNVFKAVFTKDSLESGNALTELLDCLTKQKLSVIEIIANEPPIDDVRDRQIRFDIQCEAENGELINIEMTMQPDDFEPVRLEFHAGKLFRRQDIRGKDKTFNDLKSAYQISFLVRKSFFDDTVIVHNFEYYDPEQSVSLGGRSRIITVELGKLENIVKKPVEEMSQAERWSVFFKYITDTTKREKINQIIEAEEGIAMACKVLRTISKDKMEQARLISEYKFETDHQSKMVQAKRVSFQEGEQRKQAEVLNLINSGTTMEELKQYLTSQIQKG
jgi:predicted transposase/invertase (TIGR01784 family)